MKPRRRIARMMTSLIAAFLLGALPAIECGAHEGPDPAARWTFDEGQADGTTLKAVRGPDAAVEGEAGFEDYGQHQAMVFDGSSTAVLVSKTLDDKARAALPTEPFTIAAVVNVTKPEAYGGIVGCVQDNGGAEAGWVLGYNNRVFTVAVSTRGTDDGDGRLVYLAGKTPYKKDRFHHVVATYDGEELSLYVDGKLDAVSKEPSGKILYPESAPLVIGAYRDKDEDFLLRGRISEVAIYHDAAAARWVAHDFEHAARLIAARTPVIQPKADPDAPHRLVVRPFLQWATGDGIIVTWETNQPAKGSIRWGPTAACENKIELEGAGRESAAGFIHQGRITGLDTGTQYFYKTETVDALGRRVETEASTFQTAPDADTPFAFAAISDTQGNYKVANQIAQLAWGQRPSFLLHPGDLVSTGSNKKHWTDTFFPSMDPLISRVPIYPVLGNHEQDAAFYYHYMRLPEPEYYYTFAYGNARFFMIDTNRNVGPGSEQYKWLDKTLGESDAVWNIVCHHHPPYSSDDNDYGNLWKTNTSTRGDKRARQLTTLYDKHGVDIVWTGHIHSYERTWPILNGKPTDTGGTLYMVTGGGGGRLEQPGPFRTPFENVVRVGHHYTMVHVNGRVLEARAYSNEGRLFDTFTLDKRHARGRPGAAAEGE